MICDIGLKSASPGPGVSSGAEMACQNCHPSGQNGPSFMFPSLIWTDLGRGNFLQRR